MSRYKFDQVHRTNNQRKMFVVLRAADDSSVLIELTPFSDGFVDCKQVLRGSRLELDKVRSVARGLARPPKGDRS